MTKRALPRRLRREFGARLREIRKSNGQTLWQIAEELGVTLGTVTSWERGQCFPALDRLPLLAEALGVPTILLVEAALGSRVVHDGPGGVVSRA